MFYHQGQVVQEDWTALPCFETSISIYQSTWHNIAEELHLQQYLCVKFKWMFTWYYQFLALSL